MLILFLVVIDCIWKSFIMGTWGGSGIVAAVLMFQVMVLHYQVKMYLELALTTRPGSHTSLSFGHFISIYPQDLVQISNR